MFHYLIDTDSNVSGLVDSPKGAPGGFTVLSQEAYVNPQAAQVVEDEVVPYVLPDPIQGTQYRDPLPPFRGTELFTKAMELASLEAPSISLYVTALYADIVGDRSLLEKTIKALEKVVVSDGKSAKKRQ